MTLSRQRLAQLAKESTILATWTVWRDFADQCYGTGRVASIEIETYAESDDQGGQDYSIEEITATDNDGQELRFDQSLPFFATEAWKKDAEDDDEGGDLLNYKWASDRMTDEEQRRWVLFDDLPEPGKYNETYDLTMPPSLTLPTPEEITT